MNEVQNCSTDREARVNFVNWCLGGQTRMK
jgi:hypothetical protein